MKNRLLKLFACFLVIGMLFTVNVFASEAEQSTVTPRWVSIFDIDLTFGFDGNTGCASASASKKPGASMIEGTLYVYENVNGGWVYIDEIYKSKTIGSLGMTIEFDARSGGEYKAVFVVTAYTDGVPETETVESYKVCP